MWGHPLVAKHLHSPESVYYVHAYGCIHNFKLYISGLVCQGSVRPFSTWWGWYSARFSKSGKGLFGHFPPPLAIYNIAKGVRDHKLITCSLAGVAFSKHLYFDITVPKLFGHTVTTVWPSFSKVGDIPIAKGSQIDHLLVLRFRNICILAKYAFSILWWVTIDHTVVVLSIIWSKFTVFTTLWLLR